MGVFMVRWDLETGSTPENPELSGTLTIYLWGVLLVFAIAIAIGGWAYDKAKKADRDEMWGYFLVALLWPLFFCAVLFVILWTFLSRKN
jgi:hypothetical protein